MYYDTSTYAINHSQDHEGGKSWVKSWPSHTKDFKLGRRGFSAKHTVFIGMSYDWLAACWNDVSKWDGVPTCGFLLL